MQSVFSPSDLDYSDSLQWLADVHKIIAARGCVVIIHGNEDSPDRVEVYPTDSIHATPVVYTPLADGNGFKASTGVQTQVFPGAEPIHLFRAEMTDLWREDGGWSGNYCWVRRALIAVPAKASDLSISRKILKALGATGMKRDGWAGGSDFCWRSGCIGAYAELVEG